ncbi:hypothetical protein CYR40_09625 [Chimaeribacter arupi]|nr:hypothetical protein CYR40_09625 [Chimaeribacter arupi]
MIFSELMVIRRQINLIRQALILIFTMPAQQSPDGWNTGKSTALVIGLLRFKTIQDTLLVFPDCRADHVKKNV